MEVAKVHKDVALLVAVEMVTVVELLERVDRMVVTITRLAVVEEHNLLVAQEVQEIKIMELLVL